MRAVWLGVLLVSGCGYQLASTVADPLGPLAVVAAPTIVASSAAEEAMIAGARDELAASGQLAGCDPRRDEVCPAIVLELARVEEGGAAIEVTASGTPLDRAMTYTLRGRAFVRRKPTSAPERLGVDVTEREILGRVDDPSLSQVLREEAIRRAARRLGVRLVRSIVW